MAISCDPSSLANAARCFESCNSGSVERAVKTYLLCQYANKPTVLVPNEPSVVDITAASVAGNTVLTWFQTSSPQFPPPTTTEIWKSTDGVTFAFYDSVGAGLTTYTDVAAMGANVFFYYKLRACVAAGCSGFSNVVSCCNNATGFAGDIILPTLIRAYGNFNSGVAATTIQLPALKTVQGSFTGNGNLALLSASFGSLTRTGQDFNMSGCTALATLSTPVLNVVVGVLSLRQTSLPSISMPNLVSVGATTGKDLDIPQIGALTSINFPVLATIGGNMNMVDDSVVNINFPSLAIVGLAFFCPSGTGNDPTTVTADALISIGAQLDLSGNNNLTTISFASLGNVGSNFDCSNCANLASVTLPNVTFPDGFLVNFANDTVGLGDSALGTGIDGILRRCVNSGLTTSTIDLSGGGNATPDAPGQADKATLIGNGCTVFTN